MKRPRHIKLHLAAGFSLLIFTAVIVLWVRSNSALVHSGSVARAHNRFTLKCIEGELIVAGPPPEDVKDPIAEELVSRMSGDDFVWKGPVLRNGVWHAWVQAKEGSATSLLFRRFGYKKTTDPGMAAAYRQWLAAMEDPRRYLSAHLLFLISFDQWREGNSDWNGPYLLIPLDAAAKPQVPDQRQVLRRWHDRADVSVYEFSLAWLLAPTAAFPLIWFSRPRPVRAFTLRWGFNLSALICAILLLASITAWVRSYMMAENWSFPVRDGAKLTTSDGTVFSTFLFRSITSERGKLQWYERSAAQPARLSLRPNVIANRVGYQKIVSSPAGRIATRGQSHYFVPGIQVDSAPPQYLPRRIVTIPNPTTVITPSAPLGPPDPRAPPIRSNTNPATTQRTLPGTQTMVFGPGYSPGFRSVVLSWWLLTLLFTICPTLWIWTTWRRWRRIRAQGGEHLCPVCFYDLRATPDRCPECGTAISKAHHRTLTA